MAGGIRLIPSRFVPFAGHDQFVHGSVHHPIPSRHLQSYIIVLGGSIRVCPCARKVFVVGFLVGYRRTLPPATSLSCFCCGPAFSLYLLFNNHILLRCRVRVQF
ncbi:hypothetical protein MUK42_10212 [Musa troglodytarum]|uniref:Uncharacterized protein n=1 Tax=Musa troglodytarum TaxID=320322 RepID=A0A9E7GB71_9LILI|nr:hypothetical protein MUK42_10212 [Musa troglodytarum]